jgi:HNH endonuclease
VAARPNLPRAIERAVKVEAGHRCAIPACGQHPVEIAHIEPRKKDGANDVFDNLIALCPTCHTRYDKGEIDRPAMRQYKANLSVLNGRYGDFERRILITFADAPRPPSDPPPLTAIQIPGGLQIMLRYLLEDGLVRMASPDEVGAGGYVTILGVPAHEYVALTEKGREFIDQWLRAGDLENT